MEKERDALQKQLQKLEEALKLAETKQGELADEAKRLKAESDAQDTELSAVQEHNQKLVELLEVFRGQIEGLEK